MEYIIIPCVIIVLFGMIDNIITAIKVRKQIEENRKLFKTESDELKQNYGIYINHKKHIIIQEHMKELVKERQKDEIEIQ